LDVTLIAGAGFPYPGKKRETKGLMDEEKEWEVEKREK